MSPILAPDYGQGDYRGTDSVATARALEAELLPRWVELSRELPAGSRTPAERQAAKDLLLEEKRPTLAKALRVALIAIQRGVDARLYGELVADVLGAVAATVLPVSDASLAECLAESHGDPVQWRADQPNATPEQVLDAARAMEDEARAATDAARAYRRRYRELVRARCGI